MLSKSHEISQKAEKTSINCQLYTSSNSILLLLSRTLHEMGQIIAFSSFINYDVILLLEFIHHDKYSICHEIGLTGNVTQHVALISDEPSNYTYMYTVL